jgi:predicted PolB exonuclease-like 3'-5' exonuclease
MNAVIFDIETVGCDFAQLDRTSQEYFLRLNEAEEFEQVRDSLSFYPLTAQIIAIAMMDAQTHEGAVYFQDRGKGTEKLKEENFYFYPMDECGLIKHFWKQLRRYSAIVTFNGRAFDGPFIMIRSAVHHLRVERNLVPYRFSATEHIDLADQLCFYGAMSRKFPLHMWCRALGIPSPKESGVTGLDVKDLFSQGEMLKIARYCRDDVEATGQLYERWQESFLS